jgi:4-amino-4-deoxychorismate mutase
MNKPSELMRPFRERLNAVDQKIVDLLVERYKIIREVGAFKEQNNIPTVVEERVKEVINLVGDRAGEDYEDIVCEIYALMIAIAHDLEDEVRGHGDKFKD